MIIAVDFDGILCENAFPEIGKPKYEVISLIRQLMDQGHETILWTSRADEKLVEAIQWCQSYGLHFTTTNENAPSNIEQYKIAHPDGTRKVYADIYIDDHNLEYVMDDDSEDWVIKYLKKLLRQGGKTK